MAERVTLVPGVDRGAAGGNSIRPVPDRPGRALEAAGRLKPGAKAKGQLVDVSAPAIEGPAGAAPKLEAPAAETNPAHASDTQLKKRAQERERLTMEAMNSLELPKAEVRKGEVLARHMNERFLAFCLAISAGSAVLFSLWSAWNASRVDVRAGLQEAGPRTSGSAGRRRSLKALIMAEVALAAVLLTAAGLLIQAFRNVEQVDPGFRADNVLTYQISLPHRSIRSRSSAPRLWKSCSRGIGNFQECAWPRRRPRPRWAATGATSSK